MISQNEMQIRLVGAMVLRLYLSAARQVMHGDKEAEQQWQCLSNIQYHVPRNIKDSLVINGCYRIRKNFPYGDSEIRDLFRNNLIKGKNIDILLTHRSTSTSSS